MQTIDLDRYPIDHPHEDGYRSLVARCRDDVAVSGAAVLDGFVRSEALRQAIGEVEPVLSDSFSKTKHHNCYLLPDVADLPGDHPRNRKQTTDSATLGYSFIRRDSVLNQIYEWDLFVGFVADVLGFEQLYPYADPLAPVNVLVYEEGCQTGWHFDNAAFTVTLLLQESEGGVFEYAPFIRPDGEDAYEAVADVLEGRSSLVRQLPLRAGSLSIFKGSGTLHRVTPVTAPRTRLVAVFTYSREMGTELDQYTRTTFYGRVD